MHALPGWYAAKGIDTLGSVSLEGGGRLLDDRSGSGAGIVVPSFQPELGLGERVTILLVGVDFAPGRTEHLTDTMLVATLDPDTGEGAMVSIPRDLYGVPLGDGRVYNAKLNSLLATATADRETYPLGGPGHAEGGDRRAAGDPDPLLRGDRHRGTARRDRHAGRRRRHGRANDRRPQLPRHDDRPTRAVHRGRRAAPRRLHGPRLCALAHERRRERLHARRAPAATAGGDRRESSRQATCSSRCPGCSTP